MLSIRMRVMTMINLRFVLLVPCIRADDRFRASFLWGRRPMLAASAARIRDMEDLVWVDLGGGTGVGPHLQVLYSSGKPLSFCVF